MNPAHNFSHGEVCNSHGRVYPKLAQLLNESKSIPYPERSLLWMKKEQKITYDSGNLAHKFQALKWQEQILKSPESYYKNKLDEMIVGSLIRKYLAINNPNAIFYHTSLHDDYFSGADYIVSQPDISDEFARIDLSIGSGSIRTFPRDFSKVITMCQKIDSFHKKSGIPEEFFEAVQPSIQPKPLPLLIVRMSCQTLSVFIHDFFQTMIQEKNPHLDVLEYFYRWRKVNPQMVRHRIAFILDLVKSSDEQKHITKLANQVNTLFAGINNTSVDFIY